MTSRERGTGTKRITVHAEGVEKSVGGGRKNVYRGKRHHGKREWLTAKWDPRWVNASGVEIGSRGSIDNKSLRCSRSLLFLLRLNRVYGRVWVCAAVGVYTSAMLGYQCRCGVKRSVASGWMRLYCRDLCLLDIMER